MKLIFLIAGAVLLVGCTAPTPPSTKPVVIQTAPTDRPPFNPPPIEPYRARPVDWTIITPENADRIFQEMEAAGEPVVLFGVTENGYENIAINNREALRVILQQQSVINGYREYYVRVP